MADDQQEHVQVQKTAEELKKQQERDAKEREQVIASRIKQLSIAGLDKGGLEKVVRELHDGIARLEEEK